MKRVLFQSVFIFCCAAALPLVASLPLVRTASAEPNPASGEAAQAAQATVVVNACDLGAVADGKTDVAEAIQAAIDRVARTGGRVVLPAAERPYLIGRTLRIAADNIELDATGATIQLADGASSHKKVHCLLVTGTESRPIRGIVVRGLTVDANYWQQQNAAQPRGIECRWASEVLFDRVTVRRAWVSLAFARGSSHCEARDCVVTQWHNDGFDANGDGVTRSAHHIRFVRCRAVDSPDESAGGLPGRRDDAWEIEDGATDIELVDCVVRNAGGKAFGVRNHPPTGRHTRNVQFIRFQATDAGPGWIASRTHDNSVAGIQLTDCQMDAGLKLQSPIRDLRIRGGRFAGPITSGIDGGVGPLRNAEVVGAEIESLHVNLKPSHDGAEAYQPTFTLRQVKLAKRPIVEGAAEHLRLEDCQLPTDHDVHR